MDPLTIGLIVVAVIVVGSLAFSALPDSVKSKIPLIGGASSPATDLIVSLKNLFSQIKDTALQSPESRAVGSLALTHVDRIIESFPNDTEKSEARTHLKALAALLVVQPSPATTAS